MNGSHSGLSTHSKCPATKTGAVSTRKGSKLFTACAAVDLSTVTRTSKWKYHTRKSPKVRTNHRKKHRKTVCENHIDLWSLSICVNLCHVLKNCWTKIVDPTRMVLWSSSGCLGDMMISPLFAWSDTRNRCPSDFFYPMFYHVLSAQIMVFTSLVSISDVYLMYAVCV